MVDRQAVNLRLELLCNAAHVVSLPSCLVHHHLHLEALTLDVMLLTHNTLEVPLRGDKIVILCQCHAATTPEPR